MLNIIYGIGKIGIDYIEKCIKSDINNIICTDSNSKLWNTKIYGYEIVEPAIALKQEFDKIIITVGEKNFKEIVTELKNTYEITEEKIFYYKNTCVLSGKETYNIGEEVIKLKNINGMIVSQKELCELVRDKNNSELKNFFLEEKHSSMEKWVHYFEAYERFFRKYVGKDVKILEIGVSKGGSLQMWKQYFQGKDNKVTVYGIDIDPACKKFEEKNIHIFIGSQEDTLFLERVKEEIGEVDILIDDGGHQMKQQIISFQNLFDFISDEGVYLCEDTHTSYMDAFNKPYKGDTFIEFSKKLIDSLHAQYGEISELKQNIYSECIKSITYFDSMVFIEKKKRSTKSIPIRIDNSYL